MKKVVYCIFFLWDPPLKNWFGFVFVFSIYFQFPKKLDLNIRIQHLTIFNFRLCLFGVILGRMKNEGEKSGEKIMFLVVWLRVKKRRDFGGTHQFSLLPSKTQSLQIGEKMGVKVGQNCPQFSFYYYFFFWQLINVAGLIYFFSFFFFFLVSQFHWTLIFFFFFSFNMMMCISAWICDSP